MLMKCGFFRTFQGFLYLAMGLGGLLVAQNANAVPSFARQTGMPCAACHTIFPKLTPFGRAFKLNGYTLTGLKQIEAKPSESAPGLKVNEIAPMSAMLQASMTNVSNPGTNQNNYLTFPSSLSLYYAGAISAHTGAFVQVTMDDAMSSFGFDMADLRWAKTNGGLTYGVTLDNMPGMEDLWNTTPSWTYPYPAASPDHGDGPVINTMMGTGLGAYAMLDNHWYGYLGVYDPLDRSIATWNQKDDSPIWRLAWQGNFGQNNYLMVGTYGTTVNVYAMGGNTDTFADTALDTQYERQMGSNQLSAHAVYINEAQTLAGMPSQSMNQTRVDVAYITGGHYQYQLGYFNTSTSSGAVAYMNMGAPFMMPMATGDSSGLVAEFDVMPWENTKYSIQYTSYSNLNGGPSPGDNNTLLLNAWYMW